MIRAPGVFLLAVDLNFDVVQLELLCEHGQERRETQINTFGPPGLSPDHYHAILLHCCVLMCVPSKSIILIIIFPPFFSIP